MLYVFETVEKILYNMSRSLCGGNFVVVIGITVIGNTVRNALGGRRFSPETNAKLSFHAWYIPTTYTVITGEMGHTVGSILEDATAYGTIKD